MVKSFARILPLFLLAGFLFPQEEGRKRKPVLIRVDQTESKVEDEGPVQPDPDLAKEHVKIGDFYFKKDNYKAAEDRYREAIKYHPKWSEPYQKLVRTLEKLKAYDQALEICELFQKSNPSSKEISQFQEWGEKLRSSVDDPATGRR